MGRSGGALEELWEVLGEVWNGPGGALEELWEALTGLWEGLLESLEELWKSSGRFYNHRSGLVKGSQ